MIGELADKPRIQGGGSSHIHTTRITSFIEQFEEYGIKVRYARGYKNTSFKRDAKLEKRGNKESYRSERI